MTEAQALQIALVALADWHACAKTKPADKAALREAMEKLATLDHGREALERFAGDIARKAKAKT
jgi:hypothetical protein